MGASARPVRTSAARVASNSAAYSTVSWRLRGDWSFIMATRGRKPKRRVPLDAIEFDEDESPRRYRPSPVEVALAALDAVDRRVVFQETVRSMMEGSSPLERHALARQLVGTLAALVNEARV
jgi:hypothetical protein